MNSLYKSGGCGSEYDLECDTIKIMTELKYLK